jgi:hypothetical protein
MYVILVGCDGSVSSKHQHIIQKAQKVVGACVRLNILFMVFMIYVCDCKIVSIDSSREAPCLPQGCENSYVQILSSLLCQTEAGNS